MRASLKASDSAPAIAGAAAVNVSRSIPLLGRFTAEAVSLVARRRKSRSHVGCRYSAAPLGYYEARLAVSAGCEHASRAVTTHARSSKSEEVPGFGSRGLLFLVWSLFQ